MADTMSVFLLLLTAVAAGFLNWILVACLIRVAPKIGLVDRPNERSLHSKVVPRGGGTGLVIVLIVAMGIALTLGVVREVLRESLLIYLGTALFIAAISLRDDFRSLSAGIRFFCQITLTLVVLRGVAGFETIALPGLESVKLGWWGAVLTVFWVLGLTNVYNFMDGIDGLAGVQGICAGLAWGLAGHWLSSSTITLLGLLIAAGCAGFLLHNWSPARIFMGDVGSAFLGFTFAVLPLLALRSQPMLTTGIEPGRIPVFGLLVVWPFVGDGLYTFVRRARAHEPVWRPHRSHLYQRLVRSGWPHARVSLLYAVWGVVSAAAGLCWLRTPGILAYGLMGAAVAGLSCVYVLVRLDEKKAAHP